MALPTIYLAGPYSDTETTTVEQHVDAALREAAVLKHKSWAVFVPHLYYALDKQMAGDKHGQLGYQDWLAVCFSFVERCDVFVKFAPSPGANREEELAKRLGKPIYHSVEEVPHGVLWSWENRVVWPDRDAAGEAPYYLEV